MPADPYSLAKPAFAPAVVQGTITPNQVFTQRIGNHARLGTLVGPEPLHLEFDCADADFEFALTSSWPLVAGSDAVVVNSKNSTRVRQAEVVQLAEALNALVRLYAIETGNTNMHVLVEARRGVIGVPAWWDGHPCLFAAYSFDTTYNEVGLFTDPMQAFAAMDMLSTPHRLLLAVGPARPEWAEGEDEAAWADADAQRIAALKKVEQQISKEIARLMASTADIARMMADFDGGGMASEEALMDGLARVRGAVQKMRGAILGYEQRRHKKAAPKTSALEEPRLTGRVRSPAAKLTQRQTLASTVRELQTVLKRESNSPKLPLPARTTFRRSLTALTTLEQSLRKNPVVAISTPTQKTSRPNPLMAIVNKIFKNDVMPTPEDELLPTARGQDPKKKRPDILLSPRR